MLAYLDSNVFDFVAKAGNLKTVTSLLKQRRIAVLASEYHLLESIAIPDASIRESQLKAISAIANKYNARPIAWRHAQELRFELARCRSKWINRIPREKEIKKFLRRHETEWREARTATLHLSGDTKYRHDSETGIRTNRSFQKFVRSEQVTAKKTRPLTGRWYGDVQHVDFDLTNPEEFWRYECAGAWFEAIVKGHPASRDYADYLEPYLKDEAFLDGTYAAMWKSDIDCEKVRLNRITGLAGFYQLQSKIGHGNAYDAMHANFGGMVDCLLTCDIGFFSVLKSIKGYLGSEFATPILVDRGAVDVHAELEQKLDSHVIDE